MCGASPSFVCMTFNSDPTSGYSIITKENARTAAKIVSKNMYVGGALSNPDPSSTIVVNGHLYYGDILGTINTNFNGGKTQLSTMATPPINLAYYEWLATHF